jgi:hypothetical protein
MVQPHRPTGHLSWPPVFSAGFSRTSDSPKAAYRPLVFISLLLVFISQGLLGTHRFSRGSLVGHGRHYGPNGVTQVSWCYHRSHADDCPHQAARLRDDATEMPRGVSGSVHWSEASRRS